MSPPFACDESKILRVLASKRRLAFRGRGETYERDFAAFLRFIAQVWGFLCAVLPINHESQPIGPIGYAEEVSLFSTNEVSL